MEKINTSAMATRMRFGEVLVARAQERFDKLSEETQETILFAGSEPCARTLRPHLYEELSAAAKDLKSLERLLEALRTQTHE